MAIPKITGAQRDFSYGEVDVELKRSDEHPAFKAGLRQMSNARLLNSKKPQNRPGRRALYPDNINNAPRTDRITMSPGNVFDIQFSAVPGRIQIINSAGVLVANFVATGSGGALPWGNPDIDSIVFCIIGLSIYITFTGMRPQVVSWDGVSSWTIADYNEVLYTNQKRTPFYRISPQGITLQPSATTGSVTVTASAPVFTSASVGTRIRYIGRQLLITAFTDTQHVTATVEETLPSSQTLTFAVDPTPYYNLGDEVIGSVSGSKGIVTSINAAGKNINVQLLSVVTSVLFTQTAANPGAFDRTGGAQTLAPTVFAFLGTDTVAGPGGALGPTGLVVSGATGAPQAVTIWDDEVMNALRGFPASCFTDQFRLGFCDFPAIPGGILWSAINAQTDIYANDASSPSNAIFEIAPDKVRIRYVVAGPESSEFVFCDHKIYYIKIDAQTPLIPGNVSFQTLSGDGAAAVQPRVAQDVIFYVRAGGNSVMAVVAPGAYYRPFNTKNISEFATHLFNNIVALAAPNADSTFQERYLYVLNANGSMTVGKYNIHDGSIGDDIGWSPWSGPNTGYKWVSANNADVIFTTTYFSGFNMVEVVDDTQYLDGAFLVNSPPAAFTPPGGKGPLYFIPGQSVTLMDQGTRMMGTYKIDANGFIIPQGQGGENLASSSLVAGQAWTMTIEPFTPDASPGQSVHQRMFKRRVSRWVAYFVNSTGFVMARLFSGPLTPISPPLGTIMNNRRIPAWNQGDNPLLPPPLREGFERARPLGRSPDARVAIIKDTPGQFQLSEIGIEVSI